MGVNNLSTVLFYLQKKLIKLNMMLVHQFKHG